MTVKVLIFSRTFHPEKDVFFVVTGAHTISISRESHNKVPWIV